MTVLLTDAAVTVLHPGGVACVLRGQRLETLLGSCVAILLTDRRRTIGAMCHVVHARSPSDARGADTVYGEAALAAMDRLLCRRGVTMRLCEATVLGGGNMFPGLMAPDPLHGHVGERNVAWALDALAREGVRVLHHDVGGKVYRRVRWTVGDDAPLVTAMPVT